MALKCAIPRSATILRKSGKRTFNHSTESKAQPCHARGGNSGTTTNHYARYKPKLCQVPYGCEDGGDQTAGCTVEKSSGHNSSRLSRSNRQSNQERNSQEDSWDERPFRISFTRQIGWKDAVADCGLLSSQRAKERVGELGKDAEWKSRSSKKPCRIPRRNLKYRPLHFRRCQ